VLSDLDVIQAAAASLTPAAIEVAATEPLAVSAGESLLRAAQLMSEHGVTHLIVLDATGGYPVGILSTLDVVAVYASVRSGEDRL
jgi:CBS domain-containing protein